jgi:Uncharacterized protein conserved in bacteria
MKHLYLLPLTVFLCACGGSKDSQTAHSGPSQQAYGVMISQVQSGQNQWILSTKKASFYDDSKTADLLKPYLTFNTKGQENSSVKADEGTYDMEGNLITMKGNVIGASDKEDATIKTQKAYYDIVRKVIWTDSDVTVKRGGITVKGKGIKANSDLSEIEIIKQKTQLPKELKELRKAVKDYDKKD